MPQEVQSFNLILVSDGVWRRDELWYPDICSWRWIFVPAALCLQVDHYDCVLLGGGEIDINDKNHKWQLFLNETVLLNRRKYCWIGDQESYKMLEEDKSSELQERFLQVNLHNNKKLLIVKRKENPFGTVFLFFFFSTTICLAASLRGWQKSTKNKERKQSKNLFLSSYIFKFLIE